MGWIPIESRGLSPPLEHGWEARRARARAVVSHSRARRETLYIVCMGVGWGGGGWGAWRAAWGLAARIRAPDRFDTFI